MPRTRLFSDCLRYHGYALDVVHHPLTGALIDVSLVPMPRLPRPGYERVLIAFPAHAAVQVALSWVRENDL
jgi:hypothetical protein